MIDQYNDDQTGWARFSDDMVMRYHLGRLVSDRAREVGGDLIWPQMIAGTPLVPSLEIACFLMLNPSDADAFVPDPTVTECVKFTRRWGGDITWVVNQHAFRSPFPRDLKKRACGQRGDDEINAEAILLACRSSHLVIEAWGNDGTLDGRDQKVRALLRVPASTTMTAPTDRRSAAPCSRYHSRSATNGARWSTRNAAGCPSRH